MEISQLEVFLAVAREGGFSRAAEKLYRTQSAVSQAIRKLESEIGELLFDRSTRDGVMTDAGRVLQEYAERLLFLLECGGFDGELGIRKTRMLTAYVVGAAANATWMQNIARGWLVLEVHADRAREIAEQLSTNGYRRVSISLDLAGRERVVEARWAPTARSNGSGTGWRRARSTTSTSTSPGAPASSKFATGSVPGCRA